MTYDFDLDSAPALARKSDPSPSHAGANMVTPVTGDLEHSVLTCLFQYGPLTTEGISDTTGLSIVTVSPRMRPLLRKGLVRKVGKKANRSGIPATLWEAV